MNTTDMTFFFINESELLTLNEIRNDKPARLIITITNEIDFNLLERFNAVTFLKENPDTKISVEIRLGYEDSGFITKLHSCFLKRFFPEFISEIIYYFDGEDSITLDTEFMKRSGQFVDSYLPGTGNCLTSQPGSKYLRENWDRFTPLQKRVLNNLGNRYKDWSEFIHAGGKGKQRTKTKFATNLEEIAKDSNIQFDDFIRKAINSYTCINDVIRDFDSLKYPLIPAGFNAYEYATYYFLQSLFIEKEDESGLEIKHSSLLFSLKWTGFFEGVTEQLAIQEQDKKILKARSLGGQEKSKKLYAPRRNFIMEKLLSMIESKSTFKSKGEIKEALAKLIVDEFGEVNQNEGDISGFESIENLIKKHDGIKFLFNRVSVK